VELLTGGWETGEVLQSGSEVLAQEGSVLELSDKISNLGTCPGVLILEVVTNVSSGQAGLDHCGWTGNYATSYCVSLYRSKVLASFIGKQTLLLVRFAQ